MISKRITWNFLWLFLSNTIGQGLTLWGFVQIAEVFGPKGFGQFSFAQVFVLYFVHLADFGLQTFGTRVLAQSNQGLVGRIVQEVTLLRISLALGVFALLASVTFIFFPAGVERNTILIFGVSLFPFAVLLEWVFQGFERMEIVAIGRVLRGMVFALLVYVFIDRNDDLEIAALLNVVAIAASSFLVGWIFVRMYRIHRPSIDRSSLSRILSSAYPLAAGSFVAQVNYNFGTLALSMFFSKDIVGVFSASHRLVLFLWVFAAIAAGNVILPVLARAFEKSLSEFRSTSMSLLKIFVLIAVPLGIGGTILSSEIIGYLYPPEYQGAAAVFQIAIWVVVAVLLRVVFENMLIAMKNRKEFFVGYVFAGAITLVGNMILVPVYGLVAPAVVGIASEVFLLGYFLRTSELISLMGLLKTSLKPIISGVLMGVIIFYFPLHLFATIILGFVVYLALLLVLRYLSLKQIIGYITS